MGDRQGRAADKAGAGSPEGKQWIPLQHAFKLVEEHRAAGRLAQAEHICREILKARPKNPEALHLLAIVHHQAGDSAGAIELMREAISANGAVALFHSNLTEMCRLAGRLDEAVEAGQRAVSLRPDYAEAHNNLGIVYFERDELDEAIACYRRAVALRPDFAEAHSNLGNALRGQKKYDEALACYERALAIAPNYADAYNNRGTALREAVRLEEAEASYRKALALKPNDPETLNNLALVLVDLDRQEEALVLLQRSAAIDPRRHKTFTYLASVLLDLERRDEARRAADQALSLAPASADAVQVMGRVRFEQGEAEAAIALYRRAIDLNPDMADAYNNMGNALKEIGRLAEAEAAYEKALELQPEMYGAYINLVDSKKFKPGDPHLALMEELLEELGSKSAQDQWRLRFSLGKAYADLGRHEEAFAEWLQANALKRAKTDYDEPTTFGVFDRLMACFTPSLLRKLEGHGDPSPKPVFVLGMPRSGTTLVEQILASHPMVHGAGELRDLNEVVQTVRLPEGTPAPFPEFLSGLEPAVLGELGRRYLARLERRAPGAARVTDKMPSNYYFVGLIHLILPNARVVHVRRNPADTCLSCFQRLFASEQPHTYDLSELGRYYGKYSELMAHWRSVLPEGSMLEVDYETVVADIEAEARRLVEYCGLPWDPACLAFHETRRPVKTASATQVRRPIYSSSVGRWRTYEAQLQPLLEALGPELGGS